MAYLRYSNMPPGRGQHLRDQSTVNRWCVRHSFTNEITTTPQSLSALIMGQAVNANLQYKGLYSIRQRVQFNNPQSIAGNPTIYIAIAPPNSPHDANAPAYVSTGVEISEWALGQNGYLEEKFGAQVDFLVWCSSGTAGLVFKELG